MTKRSLSGPGGPQLVPPLHRRSAWPFAARGAEVEQFTDMLEDPETSAVLIHGKAGVGKTRLALECAQQAALRNMRVETATATASTRHMPLAALTHLLPLGASHEDPVATFSEACRALAPAPPGAGRGAAPVRTVLFVDDLHLLDNVSVVLIGQLIHAGLLFLIATANDEAVPSNAVEALDGYTSTQRIELAPFDDQQVSTVLREALDQPVEHATLAYFQETSLGHALYLHEMVAGALSSGSLELTNGVWRLTSAPTGTRRLTEIIRRRLSELSPELQAILECVVVCEPLPLSALLASCSHADLERLERQEWVRLSQSGRRTFCTMAHPLYGEAIRSRIPMARRREVLLEQIAALRSYGARRSEDALQLASWQLSADLPVDNELLVSAAGLARHARDFETVLNLLRPLPAAAVTFDVLQMRGEAYHHTGHWTQADECLADAQGRASDSAQFLTATSERVQNAYWGMGSTDYAFTIYANALAGREDVPLVEQVARVDKAGYLLYQGDVRNTLGLLSDAEEIPIPRIRMWGQLQRSRALAYLGRTAEAEALSQRVYEEVRAAPCSEGLIEPAAHGSVATVYRLIALTEAGRFDDARNVGCDGVANAIRGRAAESHVWAVAHLGRCELMAGRLGYAHDWLVESIALARSYDYPRPLAFSYACLAAVHAQQGHLEQAQAAYEEALGSSPDRQFAVGLTVDLAAAWIAIFRGEAGQAFAIVQRAAEAARTTAVHSYEGWLLSDAARMGFASEVRERLAALAESTDGNLARARSLSAAALAEGLYDSLCRAAEICADIGLELLAAETAVAASQSALRSGDDRLASAANVMATRYLVNCADPRTPGLVGESSQNLTGREMEIARLAAQGLSSQEVATRLVLSVRTVNNHLQRAYSKLGISSRRQLMGALVDL
ncbi:LuxR C-terminal-related transcriptional regulator [Streptomyces rubiginosohelvolus]|uniref:LuxR C-terminal-related transcriptional regulator n=1 Tax=Streptomyces rubiginosohelvolus TaxID=67362 RepID=UPI00341E2477